MGNNSLYLGVQIGSMVAMSGIMWFFPYNRLKYNKNNIKWFYLSLFLFTLGFSFTSVVMFLIWLLLTFIYFVESRKRIIILSLPTLIFFGIAVILFFTTERNYLSSNFDFYLYVFTEIIFAFMKLPLNYQLFGIPFMETITKYTYTFEFGYFILFMKLGLIYNIFIIGLNLFILIKIYINREKHTLLTKLNLIMLTVWHVSLIHYMPALKTGPAQLFGLHIALFILFNQFTKNSRISNSPVFLIKTN